MKYHLLITLAILLSFQMIAQCPIGDVYLESQAEVDAFALDYPDCTALPGNVRIGHFLNFPSDITHLSGLSKLTSIGGYLEIQNNSNLTSLSGLDSLRSINGSLNLYGNNSLESLSGFHNLQYIGAELQIAYNDTLTDISGIRNVNLDSLDQLSIYNNRNLSTCSKENICAYLTECNIDVSIYNNADGCQNEIEVATNCSLAVPDNIIGQPIIFSEGSISNLQLSDDGTHLFVAREISEFDGYTTYTDLFINVLEWNGQEWIDLGQSPILNDLSYSSTGNIEYSHFISDFSDNGTYFATKEIRYILDYLNPYIDRLKVYEWQGGNNWSYINLPFWNEGYYSFSLSSDVNRTADANLMEEGEALVRVYENTQQLGASIRENAATSVDNINLSRDGSRLAMIFRKGGWQATVQQLHLYEWNGTAWEVMATNDVALSKSTFNTFSPDGDYLICTYQDTQRYYGWNGSAWVLEDVFQDSLPTTGRFYISTDNQRMYTSSGSRFWFWDGQSWNKAENPAFSVCDFSEEKTAMSADLSTLAIRTNLTTVVVRNVLAEDDGFRYQLPPVCIESSPRTFEQVVSLAGGIFSGAGVSEGTAIGSFDFDPVLAGIGTHEISYTIGEETHLSTISVVAADPPVLDLPDTLRIDIPGLHQIFGMGMPIGGVYMDDNGYVVDDGNGQTFSITNMPEIAETTITYTITDENACQATVSKALVLVNESPYAGGPYPYQVGSDIYSASSTGQYGYCVSLSADGSRMAVGDPNKELGEVYIYHLEGGEWVQKTTLKAGFRQVAFGAQLAMSGDGNRLIVAAPEAYSRDYYATGGYSVTGAFQMYRWTGTIWASMGGSYRDSYRGISVDISYDGTTVIAGGPAYYAYTSVYQDTGSGLVRGEIYSSGSFPYNYEGNAVALSADGQRALTIRSVFQGAGLWADEVGAFEWQNDTWVQLGTDFTSVNLGNEPDISLDITDDGSRIVIGHPQSELPGATGYVQVYDWNGTAWMQAGTDLLGSTTGAHFGQDVAIYGDGTKLIVGAANNDIAGTAAGRAVLYLWDGNQWVEEEQILIGGDRAYDQFGFSVSASANARTVAIGAVQENNPLSGGYVRVFLTETDTVFQNTLPSLCSNADPLTHLDGGFPTGGVYSGPGVTDNGDGQSFLFDPAQTGSGIATITYTLNGTALTNTLEVLPAPNVTLSLTDTLFVEPEMPITLAGTGMPPGGIYDSPGGIFVDFGDGQTLIYTGEADFAENQIVSYTYTDAQGCSQTASTEVVVVNTDTTFQNIFPSLCSNADPLTHLGGGYPTGGVYSGPGVTDNGDGQNFLFDPAQAGNGTATITYTLNGTALTNTLEVLPAPNVTLSLTDTLFVEPEMPVILSGTGMPPGGIYHGPDGTFVNFSTGQALLFPGDIEFSETQIIYYTYTDAQGCSQTDSAEVVVINLLVNTENVSDKMPQLQLFPNPSRDQVQLRLYGTAVADIQLQLYDLLGHQLWQSPIVSDHQLTQTLDLSAYAAGTYWLKIRVGKAWLSRRVVKIK